MKINYLLIILMFFATNTLSFAACFNNEIGIINEDSFDGEPGYDLYTVKDTIKQSKTITIDGKTFILDRCKIIPKDKPSLPSGEIASDATTPSDNVRVVSISIPNDYVMTFLIKGASFTDENGKRRSSNSSIYRNSNSSGIEKMIYALDYTKFNAGGNIQYELNSSHLEQIVTIAEGRPLSTNISGDLSLRVLQKDESYIQYEGNIAYPEDYTGSIPVFVGNFSRSGESTPVVRIGWVFSKGILCIKDINTNEVIQNNNADNVVCAGEW